MREIRPADRIAAYNLVSHMSQTLCDEIMYSDNLKEVNSKYKKELEKSQEEINKLKSKIDNLANLLNNWQKKYSELLKEFKPEEYKEIYGDWSECDGC